MNVSDLCRRALVTLPASATAREAARAMAREHVGSVVVTSDDSVSHVVGLVTDRDLVLDVLAEGETVDCRLGDLCQGVIVGVRQNATLREAIEAMHTGGVRRLFVTRADGSVLGLLALDDVVDALALEFEALAGALHSEVARERSRASRRGDPFASAPPRALYLPGHEP